MTSTLSSRFTLPALVSMVFLLAPAAKADTAVPIPNTGSCGTFDCIDPYYSVFFLSTTTAVPAATATGTQLKGLTNNIISGTAPGFLNAPIGSLWDAPAGDTNCCGGTVFDYRVIVNVPVAETITISGDVAAEGSVSVFLDGLGNYILGPTTLTSLSPIVDPGGKAISFSANAGNNYLDFVFSGCDSFPACTANADEPVSALLVDPSWVPALPGAIIADVPEANAIADGGVAPNSIATPEPSYSGLLGAALLALLCYRAATVRESMPFLDPPSYPKNPNFTDPKFGKLGNTAASDASGIPNHEHNVAPY
jgi:hypothetical protein